MLVSAVLVAPAVAQSEEQRRYRIDLPAGSLDFSLQLLARQTGINVGGTAEGLATTRAPAVRGRMTAAQALRRLLTGTPFAARRVAGNGYVIARRAPSSISPPTPASAMLRPRPLPPEPIMPAAPIVVTASKRDLTLSNYPGAVTVFQLDDAPLALVSGGIEGILSAAPVTSMTALGPGRNKIFLRGVADSSFNGPTQATVGLYLGEQRLIYSAPNPELRLYDVERIEVLEGPQGTLYGAGALGGIIRVTPRRPEMGEWGGQLWAGGSIADGGEPGFDFAGSANVPLGSRAAMRLLGYRGRLGGYIDDQDRGLSNVNRTSIGGGRLDLRVALGDGWTIDFEGLRQVLRTRDGQYAELELPALTRRSVISQPFDSEISVAGVTLTREWSGFRLVSATGIVRSDLETRFDASALSADGSPLAFDEDRGIELISHETRLSSDPAAVFSWVFGASLVRNVDRREQRLGDPLDPAQLADVRDATREIALFGEASLELTTRVTATAGARLVYARTVSDQLLDGGMEIEPTASAVRVLPVAALSWRYNDNAMAYVRYQQGYRAGGISIEADDPAEPTISRFDPDELQTFEIGARREPSDGLPFELEVAAFYTIWNEIQADRIIELGFPFTNNIGSGRIVGLTATGTIKPTQNLRIRGALFINETHFTPEDETDDSDDSRIPNVPGLGARTDVSLTLPLSQESSAQMLGSISYVGTSRLGVEPYLDTTQGGYFMSDASITFRTASWSIALEGTNLFNDQSNRFGFGNPFSVAISPQVTPSRPREGRLTATMRF